VQIACACMLIPYFIILFAAVNAPDLPLPVPKWARKKLRKADGPLGWEISPNFRLVSPHHWPHPIYAAILLGLIVWLASIGHQVVAMALLATQLLCVPLVSLEKQLYLEEIGELPEQGFTPPDPPGIIHGMRSCLYNLYLQFVVRADVLDLSPLTRSTSRATFITHPLPPRASSPPEMIRGLPQRQKDQRLPARLEQLKEAATFQALVEAHTCVYAKPSVNEGAGANGLYCKQCPYLSNEFAHEHSVDGSWHCVLSPSDAHHVCSRGWGERGPPIVCKNVCQHFSFAPEGWVFLYAPTIPADLEVLHSILEASYAFTTSETA